MTKVAHDPAETRDRPFRMATCNRRARDGRVIRRIRPHLRPWLGTTFFTLRLLPKLAKHPGLVRRSWRPEPRSYPSPQIRKENHVQIEDVRSRSLVAINGHGTTAVAKWYSSGHHREQPRRSWSAAPSPSPATPATTGDLAGSMQLTIEVWLKPDEAAAERFAAASEHAGSPLFRHYLSPSAVYRPIWRVADGRWPRRVVDTFRGLHRHRDGLGAFLRASGCSGVEDQRRVQGPAEDLRRLSVGER